MTQLAQWKGSEDTAEAVRNEIARRWGETEAENYDPTKNCFTFNTWKAKGYHVKKGEKAIRSITLVEASDPDSEGDEKEVIRYPKPVYLFYIKQVEQ
jgi:N-terminal domain of anti-restriction factor ArdC